jgi:shikimate dehydrogenase
MADLWPSGMTRLVPILADPVDHVQAPRHYNPAFAAAGLDWFLFPLGVRPRNFTALLAQLAALTNLQGLNITMPHKAAARELCRTLGPEARQTGVVNTMRLGRSGEWEGESFDGAGFVAAARVAGVLRFERPVFIVGAGGAGRAIAFALAGAGARELHIVDTDAARAERVVHDVREAYLDIESGTRAERLQSAGLVVNATPLGLHAGESRPFDSAQLAPDACVFDIVAARHTELVVECRARGHAVVDGRAMIVHQVAAQIAFWRGAPIDSGDHG